MGEGERGRDGGPYFGTKVLDMLVFPNDIYYLGVKVDIGCSVV